MEIRKRLNDKGWQRRRNPETNVWYSYDSLAALIFYETRRPLKKRFGTLFCFFFGHTWGDNGRHCTLCDPW